MSLSWMVMVRAPSGVRQRMERGADARIGAAATDIGDGVVDLGVSGIGVLLQQSRDRHQHARLAIAALGNLMLDRSEEHTSELQSLMRISYAVFCLKKKKTAYALRHEYNKQTNNNDTRSQITPDT